MFNKLLAVLLSLCVPPAYAGVTTSILVDNPISTAAGGGSANSTDTFTETGANVNLQSHTEGGTTWSDRNSSTNGMVVDATNDRVYVNVGADYYGYPNSYSPSDNDYCVEADITTSAANQISNGIAVRQATSGEDEYFVYYDGGNTRWDLIESNGGFTSRGTYSGDSPSGSTKSVRICADGEATSTITVYIGGVSRISYNDTSALTATGKGGLRNYYGSTGTGNYVDNFEIYETVAAP